MNRVLKALMASEWVVYSKPCLARTETVIDYLGRYSHRIALSDGRLLGFDGESVRLAYKDYRDGDRQKVMALSAEELLRRFLLHVLPKGFMRVRHFGFLANRCRVRRLSEIRDALAAPPPEPATEAGVPRPLQRVPLPQVPSGAPAGDRHPGAPAPRPGRSDPLATLIAGRPRAPVDRPPRGLRWRSPGTQEMG